jgi:hypothetical protein
MLIDATYKVCVCVYVCVCVFVCIICMYMCMSVKGMCIYFSLLPHTLYHTHTHTHTHKSTQTYTHTHTYIQGLVQGKLDQRNRQFEVTFAMGRDIGPGDVNAMLGKLVCVCKCA